MVLYETPLFHITPIYRRPIIATRLTYKTPSASSEITLPGSIIILSNKIQDHVGKFLVYIVAVASFFIWVGTLHPIKLDILRGAGRPPLLAGISNQPGSIPLAPALTSSLRHPEFESHSHRFSNIEHEGLHRARPMGRGGPRPVHYRVYGRHGGDRRLRGRNQPHGLLQHVRVARRAGTELHRGDGRRRPGAEGMELPSGGALKREC